MATVLTLPTTRRRLLRNISTLGAASLIGGFPNVLRAADRTLKVAVYGGIYKDTFDKEVFPAFTKASGIKIDSIAEPTGEAWLVQLQQAAKAGRVPADVNMMAQVPALRGIALGLWQGVNEKRLPHISGVLPRLISKDKDGHTVAVGASSWYITLVSNTKVFPEAPTSWAEFWDPKHKNQLGVLANAGNSYLLEITAKTFFGGTDFLSSDENIKRVLAKVGELRPNVRLWYRDEAQFEQALKAGEIPMGQYYHDVTGQAALDGFPVRSTMPKEGGLIDSGSWVIPKASKLVDLGEVFIDYMSQPSTQALLARKLGSTPVVDRSLTDLTDEEFAAVSSSIDPIVPRYDMHVARADWLSQIWAEMQQG